MEETPAQLTYNDYTAGWVAVLPCEIDTARLLLDHEHKRLDSTRGDANNYILGDVDGHNIAITYPGFGIKGETAETHVASNMLRTFEKIRFGLLVGVAGGAPGSRDPEDPRKIFDSEMLSSVAQWMVMVSSVLISAQSIYVCDVEFPTANVASGVRQVDYGKRPGWAIRKGNEAMVDLLLAHGA